MDTLTFPPQIRNRQNFYAAFRHRSDSGFVLFLPLAYLSRSSAFIWGVSMFFATLSSMGGTWEIVRNVVLALNELARSPTAECGIV